MNEISNFCTGQCSQKKEIRNEKFDPNNPPYNINNGGTSQARDHEHSGNFKDPLDTKTVSADAIHYNSIEYNTHNL